MAVEAVSLWPTEFGEVGQMTPIAILRQQGAALGQLTQNIVVGRVRTDHDGEQFVHRFSLYCAPLGYSIDLLVVKHGVDLYPALINVAPQIIQVPSYTDAAGDMAKDPERLKQILREIFSREKTKQIVASLLAQSRQ
jgi:hypothetical protein